MWPSGFAWCVHGHAVPAQPARSAVAGPVYGHSCPFSRQIHTQISWYSMIHQSSSEPGLASAWSALAKTKLDFQPFNFASSTDLQSVWQSGINIAEEVKSSGSIFSRISSVIRRPVLLEYALNATKLKTCQFARFSCSTGYVKICIFFLDR